MTANRDEAVALLALHQQAATPDGDPWGCETCNDGPPRAWGDPLPDADVVAAWMAEHQVAMLEAAGLQPFRTTPTKGTTP